MTVVHVLSSFGVGGQERVALDLAAAQRRAGSVVHAVSLASGDHGPLADEFRRAGVGVHAVAKRGRGIDLTLVPRLARLVRSLGADVVHTHNPQPLIYGAPAGKLAGAIVCHTKHGRNPGSRGHLALRRAAARFANAFVAVSEVTAQQAREQRDYPAHRIRTIPNGIDLARFGPSEAHRAAARAELGIAADAWVVGTVGRLDTYKNQSLLVRAAAPLLSDDFHVVIVGDGPAAELVRAAAAAVPRPDCVHLLGRRMDVDRLLPAFDVFALPSQTEGLPVVVPEAMATGLPTVCTAVGGLPGVVDEGDTGYLVPSDDEDALRARLRELAQDRARARAFGARAREVALTRYSADRMADDYMAVYRDS